MDAITSPPPPKNEPVRSYPPGSAEARSLADTLAKVGDQTHELPMTVGGVQRMGSGDTFGVVAPHRHAQVLGQLRQSTEDDADAAARAAVAAAPGWRELPFDERAAVFLRAADLLSTTWRDRL